MPAGRGPINGGGDSRWPPMARARAMGEPEGVVKVIADETTDRILGIHILSAHASDLMPRRRWRWRWPPVPRTLARSFHAHPTLPEGR